MGLAKLAYDYSYMVKMARWEQEKMEKVASSSLLARTYQNLLDDAQKRLPVEEQARIIQQKMDDYRLDQQYLQDLETRENENLFGQFNKKFGERGPDYFSIR